MKTCTCKTSHRFGHPSRFENVDINIARCERIPVSLDEASLRLTAHVATGTHGSSGRPGNRWNSNLLSEASRSAETLVGWTRPEIPRAEFRGMCPGKCCCLMTQSPWTPSRMPSVNYMSMCASWTPAAETAWPIEVKNM